MPENDYTIPFITQFHDTSDAGKSKNPIATWVKHRAILGPREAVPVRCLEPDWLDFWATYRDGIFLDGARQAVAVATVLPRMIQRWAAADSALNASLNLRSARHLIPVVKTSLLNKETYKQEVALKGLRLLSAGRTLNAGGQQRRELPNVDQVALTKEERKARRKEYTRRRRQEDMFVREAMHRGMSLDRLLAAMKELPKPLHEMDYLVALEYVLDFDARKARDKAIFG